MPRSRSNIRCVVDKFERGKDLPIKDWTNQTETYFIIGQVPPEAFTGCMQMNIAAKHLNKVQRYAHLKYIQFREKLIEILEEPDTATTYFSTLQSAYQEREEAIPNIMQRVRSYALKAHLKLNHSQGERIIVNSFMLSQHDRQLAVSVAAEKSANTSEATKLAAELLSIRRDPRARSTVTSVLPEQLTR